jgi:large subunit ribosomal protein L29
MKVDELRTLDAEELEGKLKDARRELYELRFKLAVGQLDNHRQIRQVRKDIAQILTIVHQRRWEGWEVEAEPEAVGAPPPALRATSPDERGRNASPTSEETEEQEDPVEAVASESVDSPEAVEVAEAPAAPKRKTRARKAAPEAETEDADD